MRHMCCCQRAVCRSSRALPKVNVEGKLLVVVVVVVVGFVFAHFRIAFAFSLAMAFIHKDTQ